VIVFFTLQGEPPFYFRTAVEIAFVYTGAGTALFLPVFPVVDYAAPEGKAPTLKRTRRVDLAALFAPENTVVVPFFYKTHPYAAAVDGDYSAVSAFQFIFLQRQGIAEALQIGP
jgi:hypothetical protein